MKNAFNEGTGEPYFELPIENELLMLKLRAEFGAECNTGNAQIPDRVINEFLRSVYEFERKFREPRQPVRIYDKIGQPFFQHSAQLNDKLVSKELSRVKELLRQHQLQLDVLGEYPDRLIYRFITEEFFYHETDLVDLPGYIHHFCYEDFHPNHELDIRQRTVEFLAQWFSKEINEYSMQLGSLLIHPDSREFSKAEVLRRIRNVFDAYQSFANCEYLISRLCYEKDKHGQWTRAYVAGKVRYDGKLENGDIVHVEGAFEFYLSYDGNWWSIFYFVFPGFSWQ